MDHWGLLLMAFDDKGLRTKPQVEKLSIHKNVIENVRIISNPWVGLT